MSNDKEKEEFMHDWYAILSCTIDSTKEGIEKAARKLSVKYHPDKTSDPEAPEKFLLIQKAKEILTDENKRRTIDERIRAQSKRVAYEAQRNAAMDSRRKRMRDELNDRVQKAARREPTHAEILQEELKKRSKIVEQLRRKNEDIIEQKKHQTVDKESQKVNDFYRYRKAMASEAADMNSTDTKSNESKRNLAQCQIKVKWKRTGESHSDESLYQLFKVFGPVEEAAIVGSKGTSGLITFSDPASAQRAIAHYTDSEDMRVSSLSGGADTGTVKSASSDLAADIKRALQKDNLMNIIGKSKFTAQQQQQRQQHSGDSEYKAEFDDEQILSGYSGTVQELLRAAGFSIKSSWDEEDGSELTPENLAAKEKFVFERIVKFSESVGMSNRTPAQS